MDNKGCGESQRGDLKGVFKRGIFLFNLMKKR